MAVLDRVTHTTIEHVLRPTGPVASVYLGSTPDVASEYQPAWDTRWRGLADRLRRDGADEATIAALETAVEPAVASRAAHGSHPVAAFATEGSTLAAVGLPGTADEDAARFGSPAHVLPVLGWAQERPAYVLVIADRGAADLEASIGWGANPVRSAVEEVDDLQAGAAAVAEAAAAALHRAEAKVLVLGGDVRAVQLVRGHLPTWVKQEVDVRLLTGGRAPDGSQRVRADAVAHLVRQASRRATTSWWQRYLEEQAPHGRAVAGARATLRALADGRVGLLLLSPDRVPGDARVWFGPLPSQLQHTRRPRPAWEDAHQGPLLDVAVRAAVLTGARIRILHDGIDHELADGIGGICRFR